MLSLEHFIWWFIVIVIIAVIIFAMFTYILKWFYPQEETTEEDQIEIRSRSRRRGRAIYGFIIIVMFAMLGGSLINSMVGNKDTTNNSYIDEKLE